MCSHEFNDKNCYVWFAVIALLQLLFLRQALCRAARGSFELVSGRGAWGEESSPCRDAEGALSCCTGSFDLVDKQCSLFIDVALHSIK